LSLFFQSLETTLKFCLADPGLRSASGHHAGALAALVAACGPDELLCFGHEADEDLLTLTNRIKVAFRAHFSNSFYDAYGKNWSIAESQPYVQALAKDYLRLLEHPEVANAAGVLHHTMDWPHLLALAAALSQHAPSGLYPPQIVFLMFNPGVDSRGNVLESRRFLSYRIALSMLLRNPGVRIFAASRELTQIYQSAFSLPVRIEMHPCFFFNTGAAGSGSLARMRENTESRRSGSRMLLYLGDAKAEKGFCNLPEMARRFLRKLGHDSEVVIQYVLNDQLTSEQLVNTANELDSLARTDNRVKIHKGFMADAELMAMLEKCSAVVFNYSPVIYANKTSGFLWQVCSVGLPVVVIGNSCLSREAKELSPCVRIFSDIESLERELGCYGTIRFQIAETNAEYRHALYRPLGEFLRQAVTASNVSMAAPRSDEGPQTKHKALFVDISLPIPSASAGGHAAWQELALFQALGYAVTFVPLEGCTLSAEALGIYSGRDVEVCTAPVWPDAMTTLIKRGAEFDVIYITRFNVAEPLLDVARKYAPQAKIVLNVADLHYLRQMRHAEVLGDSKRMAEKIRQRELQVLSRVDMVLSYTDEEIALINSELCGRVPVRKCPWVDEVKHAVAPFGSRRDIAFLGSYSHAPNPDAVTWFTQTVMPLLRNALPGVCFRVYGAGMVSETHGNGSDDVRIEGFVEDLSAVYGQCRVFVAPLRFGAGLKGKVAGALCRGVPCVLSPIAAEGITTGGELFAAVAQSPQEWVDAITQLYCDESAWNAASSMALEYAGKHYNFENATVQMRRIVEDLTGSRHALTNFPPTGICEPAIRFTESSAFS
jgi:glycosyltransferase involved in cell wall biosynthesis